MKKALLFLLVVITLITSCLAFTSCGKDYVDVRFVNHRSEIIHDGDDSIIRFYVTVQGGYDVADLDYVKIKFRYQKEGATFMTTRTRKAQIPENARGNPELQYVYFVIKNTDIMDDSWTPIVWYKAHVDPNKVDVNEGGGTVARMPGIFACILLGLVGALVCMGLVLFSLNLFDDVRAQVIGGLAIIVPLAFVIYSYASWGVGRGIVFTICYAIFAVMTFLIVRSRD